MNIVFFTETKWAFGQIHNSLCKRLLPYGINAEVLDFFTQYTREEMLAISDNTEYFVTTPVGVGWLLQYDIPPQKIKSVAHAQWDILLSNSQIGTEVYKDLAGYGVVSVTLKEKSFDFGISRIPAVLNMGIEFDRFYAPVSQSLNKVGYAAAFESRNFAGEEIKRGRLVQTACDKVGLPLIRPQTHYLGMPSFYKSVDAVVMSSTEEGAGLPMLEAAAAGKLCIGTPVGYFRENSRALRGGFAVHMAEDLFVQDVVGVLNYSKAYPEEYRKVCTDIQEYAREHYDWSKHIDKWVVFLLTPK
jgi:hypothetical protein